MLLTSFIKIYKFLLNSENLNLILKSKIVYHNNQNEVITFNIKVIIKKIKWTIEILLHYTLRVLVNSIFKKPFTF